MKKSLLKSAMSVLLALTMLFSLCVPALAADFTLTWPTEWKEGTPPAWALEASVEEQNATVQAILSEYDSQRAAGYDLGTFASFGAWGDMVIAQFEGGDNIGNPWGQAGRKLGAIIAPYAGMAFSVKAEFSARLGGDKVPLSNQIEWTNPGSNQTHVYQVFMNGLKFHSPDGSGYTEWGYCPGSNTTAAIAEVFKYTYAKSAWMNEALGKPVNLGCIHSNAIITDAGIVYQEFLGNDSTGAAPNRNWDPAYGVSYIVMPDQYGEEAYIITGDMMTAWATTWTEADGGYDRFAKSGAPIGNQYVNNRGVICQDFENCTIMLSDENDPKNPTVSGASCEIIDFAIGENFVYETENVIEVYLTDEQADITALTPTFTLSEGATVDKASGETQDFSEPVEYNVTAENGNVVVYTVFVEKATPITDEDTAACEEFKSIYEYINDPVSYYDATNIVLLTAYYDLLPTKQKYMLKDEIAVIEGFIADFEAIYEDPIKIAFIGDSITDPGVNASNYAVQVGEDLAKAGLPFDVRNYGASGHCLSPNSDWPYTGTDKYRSSLSFNPDIVFIMLGTNDSKPRNWEDRNVKSTFKQDLINMINTYRALESEPTVVIATVPTVRDDYGEIDTINNTNAALIAAIQKEVAVEMDCPLLDIFSYTANQDDWFNQNDGVHPNVTGHTNMKVPYLEYLSDLMDASLTDVQINGESVEDFDPSVSDLYYAVEDATDLPGVEVEATVAGSNATATVTMDEEKGICKIQVDSGLKHFTATYIVNFVEAPEYALGDVDMDGKVDVADIMKLKALIMADKWSAEELLYGDLDESGKLDVGDIMAVKNIIMGA